MRKLLTLALFCLLFCLLTTAGFGSATLVQSNAGGSASGSVLSYGTLTTSAGGFSGSTGTGHLLVFVGYVTCYGAAPGSISSYAPVISGGYGGSFVGDGPFSYWESGADGGQAIFDRIENAPSMSSAQTITWKVRNNNSGTATMQAEFELYEFGNLPSSPTLDLTTYGITSNSQPIGTPTISFSATANTDLIIVAHSAINTGSNILAGSGYTLGIDATTAVIGQTEYNLNASSGQTSAAFTGSENTWGIAAMAFSVLGSSPSSAVPRHRGSIF